MLALRDTEHWRTTAILTGELVAAAMLRRIGACLVCLAAVLMGLAHGNAQSVTLNHYSFVDGSPAKFAHWTALIVSCHVRAPLSIRNIHGALVFETRKLCIYSDAHFVMMMSFSAVTVRPPHPQLFSAPVFLLIYFCSHRFRFCVRLLRVDGLL